MDHLRLFLNNPNFSHICKVPGQGRQCILRIQGSGCGYLWAGNILPAITAASHLISGVSSPSHSTRSQSVLVWCSLSGEEYHLSISEDKVIPEISSFLTFCTLFIAKSSDFYLLNFTHICPFSPLLPISSTSFLFWGLFINKRCY